MQETSFKNVPLISVIIPIYNVEEYILEAIYSILNQTYKNLEVIVIDDCSTDNSKKIIENLMLKDNRIKLLSNQTNRKIAYSLNRGLSIAKGDYIARMDGDDICALDRIQRQYDFLQENPEIYLVGMHVYGIDQAGNIINQTKYPTTEKLIRLSLLNISPVSHIWLSRRSAYDKLNGYRELSGAEDYDFLLRMYSLKLKFTNIDYLGYSVRIRPNNTGSRIGIKQKKIALYCIKLFKQRQKLRYDLFSPEKFEKFIQSNKLESYLFYKSSIFINKAIMYRSKNSFFKSTIFLLFAAIISPYQFDYIYKKMKYRLLLTFVK